MIRFNVLFYIFVILTVESSKENQIISTQSRINKEDKRRLMKNTLSQYISKKIKRLEIKSNQNERLEILCDICKKTLEVFAIYFKRYDCEIELKDSVSFFILLMEDVIAKYFETAIKNKEMLSHEKMKAKIENLKNKPITTKTFFDCYKILLLEYMIDILSAEIQINEQCKEHYIENKSHDANDNKISLHGKTHDKNNAKIGLKSSEFWSNINVTNHTSNDLQYDADYEDNVDYKNIQKNKDNEKDENRSNNHENKTIINHKKAYMRSDLSMPLLSDKSIEVVHFNEAKMSNYAKIFTNPQNLHSKTSADICENACKRTYSNLENSTEFDENTNNHAKKKCIKINSQ